LPLRIDGDHSHEKEQRNGDADEYADDEHEAVEELLVLVAQADRPDSRRRDYTVSQRTGRSGRLPDMRERWRWTADGPQLQRPLPVPNRNL
jgi:hypothetical protein